MKVGKYTPVWGVVSLYVEIAPHTAILPKFFICCIATLEKGPPTSNEEVSVKPVKIAIIKF